MDVEILDNLNNLDNLDKSDLVLDDYIMVMLHYDCPQDKVELEQLLNLVKGKTSLLEVGSSFGGTLKRMAMQLAPNSKVVSVDYPFDNTPAFLNQKGSLKNSCLKISKKGHNVELMIADSHHKETVENVRKHGPFDFGFIDGDHSYEGVKADWENYGPMCKIVGFHDIAGAETGLGCVRFWRELKESTKFKFDEFINPSGGKGMGIGIVYRE